MIWDGSDVASALSTLDFQDDVVMATSGCNEAARELISVNGDEVIPLLKDAGYAQLPDQKSATGLAQTGDASFDAIEGVTP